MGVALRHPTAWRLVPATAALPTSCVDSGPLPRQGVRPNGLRGRTRHFLPPRDPALGRDRALPPAAAQGEAAPEALDALESRTLGWQVRVHKRAPGAHTDGCATLSCCAASSRRSRSRQGVCEDSAWRSLGHGLRSYWTTEAVAWCRQLPGVGASLSWSCWRRTRAC